MFGPDAPTGLMTGVLRITASCSLVLLTKMLGTAPILVAIYSDLGIQRQIGLAVGRWCRRISYYSRIEGPPRNPLSLSYAPLLHFYALCGV